MPIQYNCGEADWIFEEETFPLPNDFIWKREGLLFKDPIHLQNLNMTAERSTFIKYIYQIYIDVC